MRSSGVLLLMLALGCGSGGAAGTDAAPDPLDAPPMVTSQEGQACSVDPTDDPQLVCSKAQNLVCIATYARQITNPPGGGQRKVFVCRLPCTRIEDCPQEGDTCCPGESRSAGQPSLSSACVPPGNCEAVDAGP